jgi:thiol:disulfide interchange protein
MFCLAIPLEMIGVRKAPSTNKSVSVKRDSKTKRNKKSAPQNQFHMNFLDLLAVTLIYSPCFVPIITFWLVWKRRDEPKIAKFLIGLVLGVGLAFLGHFIGLAILTRNGLGPT